MDPYNINKLKHNKTGNKTDKNIKSDNESNMDIKNHTAKPSKNLRIYSYNSRGFDLDKQNVCNELIQLDTYSVPIICNQENFVLERNDYLIRKALEEFQLFCKPATKDGFNGRPTNGMFIAVPKYLAHKVKDVSPNSKRVQAIQ